MFKNLRDAVIQAALSRIIDRIADYVILALVALTSLGFGVQPENAIASYEIPRAVWDERPWTSQTVDAQDDQGHSASLRIFTLSKEHNWLFESDEEIELEGGPRSESYIVGTMKRLKQDDSVRELNDIILLGTASCEGTPSHINAIARRRAAQLAVWFGAPLGQQHVYSVNLGYFAAEDCSAYSEEERREQRRIVIVGVERRGPQVDLVSALRNALASEGALGIDAKSYSNFNSFELVLHRDWRHDVP